MITMAAKSYDPREFRALTSTTPSRISGTAPTPPARIWSAASMPLLAVGGLRVGVQLMGQQHEDARLTAIARWMLDAIAPVCVSV